MRDIFYHPWVIGLEADVKDQKVNVFTDKSERKSKFLKKTNDNKENESHEYYNNLNEIIGKKETNLIIQEKKFEKETNCDTSSKKSKNELLLIDINNKDPSLFEKVLNQVKEKNTTRIKKSKQIKKTKKKTDK